jgi:hypothetical protein
VLEPVARMLLVVAVWQQSFEPDAVAAGSGGLAAKLERVAWLLLVAAVWQQSLNG